MTVRPWLILAAIVVLGAALYVGFIALANYKVDISLR